MTKRARYPRSEALARCPLPACRRSQTCRHDSDDDPCHRFFETQDSAYNRLADKLEKMVAEARRRDPEGKNVAPEGSPEFERRHAALYRALRERDQANSANEMAELAQKRAAKRKPATTPRGA